MLEQDNFKNREDVFSKSIRAGKRTYFFDVKTTKDNDYFLTITESKKCFNEEGKVFYEKHKIFLYKEDFDEFKGFLEETLSFIKQRKSDNNFYINKEKGEPKSSDFLDIDFEDLDSK